MVDKKHTLTLTDNASGKLLPYLTANVKFIVSDRRQVLLVPNAALRYTPPAASTSQPSEGGIVSR